MLDTLTSFVNSYKAYDRPCAFRSEATLYSNSKRAFRSTTRQNLASYANGLNPSANNTICPIASWNFVFPQRGRGRLYNFRSTIHLAFAERYVPTKTLLYRFAISRPSHGTGVALPCGYRRLWRPRSRTTRLAQITNQPCRSLAASVKVPDFRYRSEITLQSSLRVLQTRGSGAGHKVPRTTYVQQVRLYQKTRQNGVSTAACHEIFQSPCS